MTHPLDRLHELGLELPEPCPPFGPWVMAVVEGSTLYTAGHLPLDGSTLITGKLGGSLTVAEGVYAARCAALSLLATLHAELGDLARVRRVVSLYGVVNSEPTFTEHTAVINGASDLLVSVFGAAGQHTRLAVGVNSLPADMALEIQAVISLDE